MTSLLRGLFSGSSRHKKLAEEWASVREPVLDGVTFCCKYMGSTAVDDPKSDVAMAQAIRRVIRVAKLVGRKPNAVTIQVSLQGIRVQETATTHLLIHTSIYKIAYCSADAHYDHVFAFIATNDDDSSECHAFLCPKRKMAQTVTISIAQAFNLAYEYWKLSGESKNSDLNLYAADDLHTRVGSTVPSNTLTSACSTTDHHSSQHLSPSHSAEMRCVPQAHLIDLGDDLPSL